MYRFIVTALQIINETVSSPTGSMIIIINASHQYLLFSFFYNHWHKNSCKKQYFNGILNTLSLRKMSQYSFDHSIYENDVKHFITFDSMCYMGGKTAVYYNPYTPSIINRFRIILLQFVNDATYFTVYNTCNVGYIHISFVVKCFRINFEFLFRFI